MTILTWIQWPILWSLLATYAAKQPIRWLIGLALASELLTTLPLGFMTIIIFLPWVIRRFYSRIKVDFSIFFFLLLLGTGIGQSVITSLALVGKAWQQLPWSVFVIRIPVTVIAAFFLLLFYDRQRNYFHL